MIKVFHPLSFCSFQVRHLVPVKCAHKFSYEKEYHEHFILFLNFKSTSHIRSSIILSTEMIQLVCLLLFLRIINTVDCTTRIGYINSSAYVPVNPANVVLYTGTYSECICFAFFSNISSPYQALNFYKDNNTCFLFTSFLSRSYIQINTYSIFTFLQISSTTTPPTTTIPSTTTPTTTIPTTTTPGNFFAIQLVN